MSKTSQIKYLYYQVPHDDVNRHIIPFYRKTVGVTRPQFWLNFDGWADSNTFRNGLNKSFKRISVSRARELEPKANF